jgi:hypothetical protein
MSIYWPDNTTDIIDDIRDAIGRDITIYATVSGIPCPTSGCSLDPVTNLSVNQFCVTCGGDYWIDTASGVTVTAHVRMKNVDVPVWTVGGFIVDGDAQIQVKYTEAAVSAIESAEYYEVDGKEFIQKDLSFRGVPTVNRVVVTLVEKEG